MRPCVVEAFFTRSEAKRSVPQRRPLRSVPAKIVTPMLLVIGLHRWPQNAWAIAIESKVKGPSCTAAQGCIEVKAAGELVASHPIRSG